MKLNGKQVRVTHYNGRDQAITITVGRVMLEPPENDPEPLLRISQGDGGYVDILVNDWTVVEVFDPRPWEAQ